MQIGDSLTNIVSGLGTRKDKLAHGRFRHNLLSKYELQEMYNGDAIAGKIVDAPVDDSLREWRTWSAGPRQVAAIEAEEKRLNMRVCLNRAMKMSRLYGGSGIIIGDGGPHPEQELDLDRIKKNGIKYLHALSRWELWVSALNRDPLSPYFGEPEYYEVHGGMDQARVHPSRVIRFIGMPILELSMTFDGWGYSILQRAFDAVRNVASTANNIASLAYEAKVDVISIPNLTVNAVNPGFQAGIISRFALANEAKSNQNALLLDADEKWDQKQVSFAGLVDVLNKFLEVVAGAADIPVTRLLGTSPKGLNATGQSDIRSYYDMLAARQAMELGPVIARLDEALIRSAIGTRPASITYGWNSLWQMDETEQAAIGLQKAQTAQIYATLGVMPPTALREGVQAMLIGDKTYPGLQASLERASLANELAAPLVAKAAETSNEIDTPSAGAKVVKTNVS